MSHCYTTIEYNKATTTHQHATYEQVIGVGCKRLPIQTFKLQLSSGKEETFKPGDIIKGNVILKNSKDLGCLGIAVSLEGFASVSYKAGSGVIRKKVEKLLPPEANYWSTVFLVGCPDDYNNFPQIFEPGVRRYHKIKAGEHILPFEMSTVKLNPFAGTFKGTSGEVSYRVIACVIIKRLGTPKGEHFFRNFTYVECPVEFQSYLNLETLPLTTRPVFVESKFPKNILAFTVFLSQTGFLSGEDIIFAVETKRSWQSGNNANNFHALLICKTTYSSDVSCRVNSAILASREHETQTGEWAAYIRIPCSLYPSVSGQLIQRQYFVKFGVYPAELVNPIVNEAIVPITIGTVREDESLATENNQNLSRSMSLMSISSSTSSVASIPPSYEDLFYMSPPNQEQPPPRYEDAVVSYHGLKK